MAKRRKDRAARRVSRDRWRGLSHHVVFSRESGLISSTLGEFRAGYDILGRGLRAEQSSGQAIDVGLDDQNSDQHLAPSYIHPSHIGSITAICGLFNVTLRLIIELLLLERPKSNGCSSSSPS